VLGGREGCLQHLQTSADIGIPGWHRTMRAQRIIRMTRTGIGCLASSVAAGEDMDNQRQHQPDRRYLQEQQQRIMTSHRTVAAPFLRQHGHRNMSKQCPTSAWVHPVTVTWMLAHNAHRWRLSIRGLSLTRRSMRTVEYSLTRTLARSTPPHLHWSSRYHHHHGRQLRLLRPHISRRTGGLARRAHSYIVKESIRRLRIARCPL